MRERRSRTFLLGGVAVAIALAVAIVGIAMGGDGGPPVSRAEYQAAVVNTRDRADFALERITKVGSQAEFLARMDEASVAIDAAADDLDDVAAPSKVEDETDDLVGHLRQLSVDIKGTADQAREVGFEEILTGATGLNWESWDRVNEALAELRKQGIKVQPLARH
jgi:hypothetical protein